MGDFAGLRASVARLAQTREEAIEHCVELKSDGGPGVSELEADDVVVEVRSSSVSYIDLIMLTGQYHHRPRLPYTPGLEYAGVVRWAGAGVSGLREGDRVLSDFLHTGPRSSGPHERYGGWAQYAVAKRHALFHMSDAMTFDAACNLLLNYETAYFALVTRARLQAGETVLITGATGAAGLAAVQTARILGAKVIATSRSATKLRAATQLGADHVIDLTELKADGAPRLRDLVKTLTGGRGADVLYDTVGGTGLTETLRCLSFGARMVIIGWAENTGVSGAGGQGGSLNPDLIPTNLIQLKNLTIMGSPMVITSQRDPKSRAERHAVIFDWLAKGLLTPHVSRAFRLEELQSAMRVRLKGEASGACVVNPNPTTDVAGQD
jgi:NADPH:quinone reductase